MYGHSRTSPRTPFPGLDDAERTRHKGELVASGDTRTIDELYTEHLATLIVQSTVSFA